MVVNKKTKAFIELSNRPNHNWMGEDWYLVPDNSELANKIKDLYPRYDFVLDGDKLVDVVEVAKTEEEIKQEKEQEILSELEVLDDTVDRQWEDYYIKWEITPVDRIAVAIAKKEALRQQLKEVL